MRTVDWIILVVSLVGIIGYGLYRARGSRTAETYLLAGKTMRWWVIGLSIMATQASAITFIGTTGQGYSDGMRFVQFYFGLPIAMVIISAVAAPRFARTGVYTAYEYLEKRFDPKTRTLTSFVFLIQRGLGVGLALYAPAVVLSVILGWSEAATIAAMGLIVVAYTVAGGIKAVMWTDAQQMLVMFLGILAAFFSAVFGLPSEVSFGDALSLAGAANKLQAVDLHFDPASRYNLWSGLIGGSFLALAYFGTDQSQVQRYLTAKNLTHSRVSLLFNAVVKVPLQFCILLTGAMVFAFFLFEPHPALFHNGADRLTREAQPERMAAIEARYTEALSARREAALALAASESSATRDGFRLAEDRVLGVRSEAVALAEETTGESYNDTNYVFLNFVIRHLPAGIVGLIIAAVFAAAMSTISAELNSLATATTVDHYQRYVRPGADQYEGARAAKVATAFWGLYATIFASFAGQLGSLIEAVNIVGSLFYGSMLGVFVLAFGFKRCTGTGAFLGVLAGLGAVAYTRFFTETAFLWWNPIGCLTTVAAGLALSGAGSRSRPAPSA